MEKNTLLEKMFTDTYFNFKQVHEQQCLKVTQCSMMN